MKSISELIEIRKSFADAIIKNKYDLSTVLVGLYADDSHFIYEILQNAEDSGATEIAFELQNDQLIIKHNGKPFNEDDIETITAIALKDNEKREQLDKIGKFGIGFKSVYAITSTPRIQSGIYDFVITQFVLPDKFSDSNSFPETIISLPFDHNDNSANDTFNLILRKFESFENYNLLFLSNLKSITFLFNNKKKSFAKKSVQFKNSEFAEKVTIIENDNEINFLLFKSGVKHVDFQKLKNKQYCAIAFELNTNNEIVKASTSNLFVFFETNYETYLNFLIQAPFITTPPRDNIKIENSLNIQLIEEVNDLVVKTLKFFSDNNLIALGFLEQLPLENKENEKGRVIYNTIFETVKSELLSDGLYIPTITPDIVKPVNQVALVRGRELISILSSVEDLEELFGRKYWVNTDITSDKAPKLFNYFRKELDIPEYGPEDFARRTSKEYFERKSDPWVMKLYEFLNGRQESLWRAGSGNYEGVLRRKPFIRLENGKHITPFDEKGRPVVFLPFDGNKLDFNIIKEDVIISKPAKEFIKDKLGIKEPNIFDEIKFQILPQYSRPDKIVSYDKHLQHMQTILEFYFNTGDYFKQEIKRLITESSLKIFLSKDGNGVEISYQSYDRIYLYDEKISRYFRYTSNVYFLDIEKYETLPQDQLLLFCKDIFIVDYPKIFPFEPKFTYDSKRFLRENSLYYEKEVTLHRGETIRDFKIHGLNDILSQDKLDFNDSVLIWDIICRRISRRANKLEYEKGKYEWFYKYPRETHFPSNYIKCLRESKWLFLKEDKESGLSPIEIMLNELPGEYDTNSEPGLVLVSALNFKQEELISNLDQIPEEHRDSFIKFASALELSKEKGINFEELLEKAIAAMDQIELKDVIENAPELSDLEIEVLPFENYDNTAIDIGVDPSDPENTDGEDENKEDEKGKKPRVLSQEAKDKIGMRGEKIVFTEYLKDKYSQTHKLILEEDNKLIFEDSNKNQIEILHLNSDNLKHGTGCDIIIRNAAEIIEYIEVKSTETNTRTLFQVSGTQWALAHKLFNERRGNDYKIFVVRNVFGNKPTVTEIVNPIKKWKDGELRAHPVNFDL